MNILSLWRSAAARSFSAFLLSAPFVYSASVPLSSPNGRWQVSVQTAPAITLDLKDAAGKSWLTQEVGLSLTDGQKLEGGEPLTVDTRSEDSVVIPTLPVKQARLRDHFNEATIQFANGFSLIVRVYDDGLAYRFKTQREGRVTVASEKAVNRFPGDPTIYYGAEKGFYSHTEVSYAPAPLSQQTGGALTSLPLLVRSAEGGPALVFSETALEDYPGQWIVIDEDKKALRAVWPGIPVREEETSDRDIVVHEYGPHLAETSGTRSFPWRFVALASKDAELLTNTLSYQLADPSRVADTSWIKPGKVQWDWWHEFNVWDTPFAGGVSQELYMHYIDFAAAHRLQYIVLDEGWYKLGDLITPANNIDVPALVEHGRKKGVGVILWSTWSTLKNQFDQVMPMFEKWGVAGLKVDFFQRDDQAAIQFYWKLAAEGAKRKLLLDFHGAHKPAGLQRTYPNVVTFEGVKGLENAKWSEDITPEHNTTLPFIRQVAGPMDYTPGAMDNAQKEQFRVINRRPMSMGTRAHQLALYVVFESPLQMLADSPSAYRREPEAMAFLEQVPVIWDETRVLEGEIGVKVALARRSGDRWFIAALNNSTRRTLTLDLSFLPQTVTSLEVWKDGPNADRDGRDSVRHAIPLAGNRQVTVDLAVGGGWVAVTSSK